MVVLTAAEDTASQPPGPVVDTRPNLGEDPTILARAHAANAQAVQDSRESVWFLKEIAFHSRPAKIITQNYNGPCSFIAICNILILRGDIQILPPERTSVSYEFLSQLVGEYLLRASPDVDLSAALSMMPLTQKGMDLNPLFTSPTAFRPAGDGGALKLFEQAGIQLVHGWLVDPESAEATVVSAAEDYDTSVNLIVEADTVSKGLFVVDESAPGPSTAGPSSVHTSEQMSELDQKKIEDALVVRNFIESSSSQLTYHGLFTLASTLTPGALVALFRNSHLSVLHRPDGDDASLYALVTDHIFYNEASVVWERLEDVDGGSSTFVDAEFRRSSPVGGDFAGATAEGALAAYEAGAYAEFDPADHELARQLQAEEDARAHEVYAQRERERARRYQQQHQQQFYDPNDPRAQQQRYPDPRDPRYRQLQHNGAEQQYQSPPGPPPREQLDLDGPEGSNQRPPLQNQLSGKPLKMKRKQSCIIM